MSYSIRYYGGFKIEPPLTKPEFQRLAQLVNFSNSERIIKQAKEDVFDNGIFPLTTEDKKLLLKPTSKWNIAVFPLWFRLAPDSIQCGNDEGYPHLEGVTFTLKMIANWLQPLNHKLSGEVKWEGEENSDSGTIYISPGEYAAGFVNRVEAVNDVRHNPGPSWSHDTTGKK